MGYKKVKTISTPKKDSNGDAIKTADGKAMWINCGSILKDDNGKLLIVIDAIPVSALGHGSLILNVFEPRKFEPKKKEKPEVTEDELGF